MASRKLQPISPRVCSRSIPWLASREKRASRPFEPIASTRCGHQLSLPPLAGPGPSSGVAWGDYDGDGDADLYVSNHDAANHLLRNDGQQTFIEVTSGPLGDAGAGQGAVWGDCDRDGDLDLYLSSWDSNRLLRNDGGARLKRGNMIEEQLC